MNQSSKFAETNYGVTGVIVDAVILEASSFF